ncbi:polysaccharide deacetylase [Bacillus sp. HMF5848]|uniref:polysaccharide deacetylase family protein n=1 Tax=Bacillus sp. HMF5848 TaxID=2495421 RepID=UPI000F7A2560|nr:polysaccharide deacetylase family protein [Bacillus sp. HMF5848]RSK28527.1 polysaccharide deacetylase [Bacillus sp. HMF5848]
MKKKLILLGAVCLLVFTLLIGTYRLMNARTFQIFGGLTAAVQTDKKVVALTFDDGPTNHVNDILPILKKYDAKATFFLIGNEIEFHLTEAKMLVNEGHQLGNHTYSHKRMIFKTPAFIKREIEITNLLIEEAGYKGEIDFRPPNGKKLLGLPYYLFKHNTDTITWNLEPDSLYTSSTDKINYVVENVRPGSIILLHPMYDKSGDELKTVEGILDTLTKDGYQFITVNDLQKYQN